WENNRLVKYQRIECPELSVDNELGTVNAGGPGTVRIFQPGTEDMEIMPGKTSRDKPAGSNPKEEMKLTRVQYLGRMLANNKQRLVTFTARVDVYHLPAERHDVAIDTTRLPPSCLHMRCEELKVLGKQPESRSSQVMIARGRAEVQAQEFFGRAETISYDEGKDQMIFDGGQSSQADLYQMQGPGQPPR